VVHDYLPRLVGADLVEQVLTDLITLGVPDTTGPRTASA